MSIVEFFTDDIFNTKIDNLKHSKMRDNAVRLRGIFNCV